MAGSFWQHLLYTVPRQPYKCIIILDGDKKQEAEEVCRKYEESNINASKFKLCATVQLDATVAELKSVLSGEFHPIYCLGKKCIEEYLDPRPNYEDVRYDKKKDGPEIAEKMTVVPQKIEDIFTIICAGT